jgi:hypothetical protein
LRAIVDLTPLQKSGEFKGLAGLVHILNKKRGVQLVVLYLEFDGWRVPWGFRLWRGKDHASPATLALKLLRTLPRVLTARHRVMVLTDSGFCSTEFVEGVRRLGHHAVVGVRRDRRLTNGTRLDQAATYGEGVFLKELEVSVYVASYWLKKRDGAREKRFVICTKVLSPAAIVRWGKKRWSIEGFFKIAKGRFSLERFGQATRLRGLPLSAVEPAVVSIGALGVSEPGM